jgi:hypothetical protein
VDEDECQICGGWGLLGTKICPECGRWPPDAVDLEDMEQAEEEAEAEGLPLIFYFGPQ